MLKDISLWFKSSWGYKATPRASIYVVVEQVAHYLKMGWFPFHEMGHKAT